MALWASVNETWFRVCRPSSSAPLTKSFICCRRIRGDTPGNSFLKQLEGVIGSHDSSLGPIRGHRALSIPERLQIVWYWITLNRSLHLFSQRHLHYSLTLSGLRGENLFFFLQVLDERIRNTILYLLDLMFHNFDKRWGKWVRYTTKKMTWDPPHLSNSKIFHKKTQESKDHH